MSIEYLSPIEAAVNERIEEAGKKVSFLQDKLNNLPPDKGPELKPVGGPTRPSSGQQKVLLKKEIAQVKDDTLKAIDELVKNASAFEKEKCEYAVGKWLHPGPIDPRKAKTLDDAQTRLARQAYEKKNPEKQLERADHKTMEQSERFMWQVRYKQDMPAAEPPSLSAKDVKDLDQSQDFVFNRHYGKGKDIPSKNEHMKASKEIEPEKE